MDIPEKTGEALHLFAQTPRKWELSLVYHFSFSIFFVPFLCRCSLADDIRHEGACLKKLKSFRESRRCLALQRRSWHSTIVPTYSAIVPTYSTIVPTFEQKCLAKKNPQPQAGCVKHRCLTDIKRQRCFFVGSGAAIFLGAVTGAFRILRSGAHLLASCTRRIPTYMMRLRYFRNHDKSILQSGTHAWAPCTHKNLRFRDAHFYLSKRKGGFLMTEMRNYGKIVLRAKYFLWN